MDGPSNNFSPLFHLQLYMHAITLLLWKKILSLFLFKVITLNRPSTLFRIVFMERSGCLTKWVIRGFPLQATLNFLFLLDTTLHQNIESHCPSPNQRTHIEKKVLRIAFRKTLPKILLWVRIFSYTVMTYLKTLVWTKFLNRKWCPAGFSPKITLPVSPFFYQKCTLLWFWFVTFTRCGLSLLSLNLYKRPLLDEIFMKP